MGSVLFVPGRFSIVAQGKVVRHGIALCGQRPKTGGEPCFHETSPSVFKDVLVAALNPAVCLVDTRLTSTPEDLELFAAFLNRSPVVGIH